MIELPFKIVEDLRRFLTLQPEQFGPAIDPIHASFAKARQELAYAVRNGSPRLLSLHIPKTAGKAFGQALAEIFGPDLYWSYWEVTDCSGRRHVRIPETARCVHGHVLLQQVRSQFPGAALVTWVREPVQRLVSFYQYWLREPDWRHPLCCRLHAERLSLLEFAAQEETRNEMTRRLGLLRPVDFSFIGLFEDFPASMDRFFRVFGWQTRPVEPVNTNPQRRHDRSYALSPEQAETIAALNSDDCALYRECLELHRLARAETR